jgi:dihydroorotase
VGHGQGSFQWEVAERALQQDVEPQTISSDLHVYNVNGPVYDLATTVSKFLHLGLPLEAALAKVTATPAQVIRMGDQLGTLKAGAWGDAVVLELQEGEFELRDAYGEVRLGRQRLVPATVVRSGKRY